MQIWLKPLVENSDLIRFWISLLNSLRGLPVYWPSLARGNVRPWQRGPAGAPEPRGLDGANVMWEGLGACRGPRGHFALASAPDTFLLASRPQKCPYMMREDAHHAVYQPCVGLPTWAHTLPGTVLALIEIRFPKRVKYEQKPYLLIFGKVISEK